MSDYICNIYDFRTKHFIVKVDAIIEPDNPSMRFDMNEEELHELYKKINDFDLVWFCARATIIGPQGEILGTDYLGWCCYENYEDFRTGEYFRDMVRRVCDEARETWNNRPVIKLKQSK